MLGLTETPKTTLDRALAAAREIGVPAYHRTDCYLIVASAQTTTHAFEIIYLGIPNRIYADGQCSIASKSVTLEANAAMSIHDFMLFVDRLEVDDAIRNELDSAAASDDNLAEKFVELGSKHNLNFTEDEVIQVRDLSQVLAADGELTDQQMETISGGLAWNPSIYTHLKSFHKQWVASNWRFEMGSLE